ncbi:MAG: flagellar basal body L-ring protein FlgH [Sporomusaceae bacterium]|nr:flagellar basal body L-ring protein FlgH [Sporomusaceae bacterium]
MMSNIYIKATILSMVLALALLVPLQHQAEATSLWAEQTSLFGDRKARAVGDSLTIVISESSTASRSGTANNSKSASNSMAAGTGVFKWLAAAEASGKDSFKADGKITNTNAVTGRITVQVTGVKPNGNLLVSGTQSINQNGEEQKITITGEVRPEDISADNAVLSSNVANAQLKIDGKGPIANKQRQGILTQIFNLLF